MEKNIRSNRLGIPAMNILFWNPTYVLGGGLNLLTNLLDQISQHPQVTSITAAIHKDYEHLLPEGSWNAKVRRVLITPDTRIESVVSQNDVVYMTWPHGVDIPNVSIPTVCIYQDTILLDAYGFHTTRSFIEEMERAVRHCVMGYSTVIVTSLYTQQRFRDILGDEGIERVVVLPHIASPSDPKMLSHERSLATPASTPLIPQPYLLYPSNVSEHKNHLALMLALSKRRRKDVQLVLCGYGTESIGHQELKENPYLNRLNKSIRDRGLQTDIDYRALGYVSDEQSEDLLSNALGLIMPTRAEGMGLPIHEAIERGLPVIASDIPVLREHYDSRSNAILWVDPDCPADIAEAWDSLCERSHSLKSLARATNLGSGVSWADIASRTVNILDEAIQTHRPVLRIAPLKRRRRWMKKIEKSIKKLWRRAG